MNKAEEFLNICYTLRAGETITIISLDFESLFMLKNNRKWWEFNVDTHCKEDILMQVWNKKHPIEDNIKNHVCKAGNRIKVWTVSRFGDICVTDNFINPTGYDARGIDIKNLYNWEITRNLVI